MVTTLRVFDHWRVLDNGRRLLVTTPMTLDHWAIGQVAAPYYPARGIGSVLKTSPFSSKDVRQPIRGSLKRNFHQFHDWRGKEEAPP